MSPDKTGRTRPGGVLALMLGWGLLACAGPVEPIEEVGEIAQGGINDGLLWSPPKGDLDCRLPPEVGSPLFSPAPVDHEWFGVALAASGGRLLVGAPGSEAAGPDASGAAFLFERDPAGTWVPAGSLLASDATVGLRLGGAVALSGRRALVGTFLGMSGAVRTGAAYVFEQAADGIWRQRAKLVPREGKALELFGAAVALDGDRAVVGAFQGGARGAGVVYVFVKQGLEWQQEARLQAATPHPNAHFGISVALSGDTIAVGADTDDEKGFLAGAAHVFVRRNGQWQEQARLTGSATNEGDFFGYPVSLSGDTLVVGAHQDDTAVGEAGAVYVFRRRDTHWSEEAKLVSGDALDGAGFGIATSILGDTVAVGAYMQSDGATHSGSAYVFQRGPRGWNQERRIHPDPVQKDAEFGASVALSSSGRIAVGAPGMVAARASGALLVVEPSRCGMTDGARKERDSK